VYLEDESELAVEVLLHVTHLIRRHLTGTVLEHLLTQQQQDVHVVGAEALAGLGGVDQVRDKGGPTKGGKGL
jgi:hypothetical protein